MVGAYHVRRSTVDGSCWWWGPSGRNSLVQNVGRETPGKPCWLPTPSLDVGLEMELYAFGYNGDGQITSANDDKNQVQSTCCEPTRISFEDVTKLKGVESELAAFPRPSVNRETGQFKKPSSSKSPDDQTERSSLGEKVFGSISWSNILFVAGG